jgi:hypothetical protein
MSDTAAADDQLKTSIHALGVGCCKDPFDEEELYFTISYSDNFLVLTTFAIVVGTKGDLFERLMSWSS